jgi:hypothetical protein
LQELGPNHLTPLELTKVSEVKNAITDHYKDALGGYVEYRQSHTLTSAILLEVAKAGTLPKISRAVREFESFTSD